MKAILIDDEPKARRLLEVLLKENCPKIKQIIQAEDLLSGVALIKEEEPQLVFLDIEMPEYSGLEILNFIDKESLSFEIIFTTAYSEYAIQAFELSAVDYLLKPLRAQNVLTAVEKAITNLGTSRINLKLEELKKTLNSAQFKKIALPVSNGIRFVPFEEIMLLEADGMYTKISTIQEEILISKPLRHFVELLDKIPVFYKPHRSFLINLSFIQQYVKSDGGYILMDNGKSVSISKDKKEEFLELVNTI